MMSLAVSRNRCVRRYARGWDSMRLTIMSSASVGSCCIRLIACSMDDVYQQGRSQHGTMSRLQGAPLEQQLM